MLNPTLLTMMFIGVVLFGIGMSVLAQTSYSVPPIPAGWAIGLVLTVLGASIDVSGILAILDPKEGASMVHDLLCRGCFPRLA